MTIDVDKAKQALASLQKAKQEQNYRLQLAAEVKRKIDIVNAYRIQSFSK